MLNLRVNIFSLYINNKHSNIFFTTDKHNPPFIYICLDAGLSRYEVEKG